MGIVAMKLAGTPAMDTVTCEYVRRVDGQVVGYVFYTGSSPKAMTGQAVMARADSVAQYEVGKSYSVADSALNWTFGH
jgi:hypothetical protein